MSEFGRAERLRKWANVLRRFALVRPDEQNYARSASECEARAKRLEESEQILPTSASPLTLNELGL